jgi:Patatin-like phospholipase
MAQQDRSKQRHGQAMPAGTPVVIALGPAAGKRGHGGPGFEPGYPVSAALSGGGVRAALFGLGVLMAMRDARTPPVDIASVSGGSITNAMLAARYYSRNKGTDSEENADSWQKATREVFDDLCAGSLTKPWVIALGAYAAVPILALPAVIATRQIVVYAVASIFYLAWAITLLLRGLLIEALMARRYLGLGWRDIKLHDLDGGTDRQHIFCCTDLVLGKPVHYSSTGLAFRRLADPEGGRVPLTIRPRDDTDTVARVGQVYASCDARLSPILRATAGFPGIPPKLVTWPQGQMRTAGSSGSAEAQDQTREKSQPPLPTVSFLSDGGIWNNLATEPFSDNFVLSAGKRPYGPWVVLVADASGVVGHIRPGQLRVPGWSELKALIRQASIQNTNTVTPRRVSFGDDMFLELRHPGALRFARERLYCPISCSETPKQILTRYERSFNEPDQLRYQGTGSGIPARYASVAQRLADLTRDSAVMDHLETLAAPPDLVTAERDELALYPTTLGRVRRPLALGLVARGYANTALTLYLNNLSTDLSMPSGWLASDH